MNHFSHSGVFFLASGGQSCDDACAAGGIGHGDGKSLACDLDKVENSFFCHVSLCVSSLSLLNIIKINLMFAKDKFLLHFLGHRSCRECGKM